MPQLLSLCSRAREPKLLKPACQSLFSATREATAMRSLQTAMKSSPCSLHLETAQCAATKISANSSNKKTTLKKSSRLTDIESKLVVVSGERGAE